MTTTKKRNRVATGAPFGASDALDALSNQIEAAKVRFRATNQWARNQEKSTTRNGTR